MSKLNDDYLEVSADTQFLKHSTVRGSGYTVVSQVFLLGLKTISTMLLARILRPSDFGLIGMVYIFINLGALVKDMGLSMATIQRENIKHSEVSNLFWINISIGFVLMLFTALCAPLIGSFYNEPVLVPITIALSSVFLFGGLTIQHQAILQRKMKFATLAVINVIATFMALVTALISALFGMNYWSLAIQQISLSFFLMLMTWLACKWRPSFFCRSTNIKELVSFGANISIFGFLNYFIRNLDKVLIGRFMSPRSLGLYERSYQLFLIPISQLVTPLTGVAVPALSRLQNEPARFLSFYKNMIRILSYLVMPITAALSASSSDVVAIILGPQWTEAGIIFKVLTLTGIQQCVSAPLGWIFFSLGKADLMVRWALVSVPLYAVAFLIGLKFGILGVACAYALIDLVMRFYMLELACSISFLTKATFLKSVFRPFVIAIVCFFSISAASVFLKIENPILSILVFWGIAALSVLFLILCWKSLRKDLVKIPTEIKSMLTSKPIIS